jgi:hypothetical protein
LAFRRERSLALAALLITSACVFIPLWPAMPAAQLDESWALALNEAVVRGFRFGHDVIFTMGPYASIFSEAYHPATDTMILTASAWLAICYWLALVHLTRGKRWLPWIMTLVLAGVLASRDARDALLLSFPFVAGLCCLQIACAERPGRRELATIAIVLSAFGLLPLVKGTLGVACGLTSVLVTARFATSRRWRFASVALAAPLAGMLVFWLAAGQPLSALPGYAVSLLHVVAGYGEAMARPGPVIEVVLYLVGAAIVLASILLQTNIPRRARLFLFGLALAYLFVVHKSAFIRHDSHALIAGQSLLVAAVLVSALLRSRLRPFVIASSAIVWIYIDHQYLETTPAGFVHKLATTYTSSARGLWKRASTAWPRDLYDATLRLLEGSVPMLDGTTDTYSFDQATLIGSRNRWNPRPVIQSYAVFDADLAEINRSHLAAPSGPDNVILRVTPVDGRLPSLEDAASWSELLSRFVPTGFSHDFLLLRRRAPVAPQVATIESSQHLLRKRVAVPDVDAFVFARIELQPGVLGALAGVAYKRGDLMIDVTLANGLRRKFRFVPSMGRIGVLISPLVETTEEFAALYSDPAFLAEKKVRSFAIAPAGSRVWWHRAYNVTFERVAVPPVLGRRQLYELLRAHGPPDELVSGDAVLGDADCDGAIDDIAGLVPPPPALTATGLLSVSGWVASSAERALLAEEVYVVLTGSDGRHALYRTHAVKRPDVGDYFHDTRLAASGYAATIDVSSVEGIFALQLAFREGDHLRLCASLGRTLVIRSVGD